MRARRNSSNDRFNISINYLSIAVYLFLVVVLSMWTMCTSSQDDTDWSSYLRFDVKNKMVEHKVTPTAVRVAPKTICHVQFDWGEVEPGQTIQKTSDKVAPPMVTWDAKNGSLYLLMSFCVTNWFDIRDAPEQDRNYTLHEWNEWIVYNIPQQNVHEGAVLYDYEPSPRSKDKNVTHLVIYLVYEQNGTTRIPSASEINWSEYEDRRTAAGFAKRYKLGDPVAGNFYYIRYDQELDDSDAEEGQDSPGGDSETLESDSA